MIPVTKPFFPPIDDYVTCLKEIWATEKMTNNGPFVKKLEEGLRKYFELNNLLFVSNGTIALQLAIKALGLKGEIITTPFSFVATTSSIVWEGCKPVFVDIDPNTFNIDPSKIEALITQQTSAILATHCFGNACDIDRIEEIAKKNKLKVIYDAAHCFGTNYKGKSIFAYGDISTASFHATKLFHTVEGGAVFSQDDLLLKKLSRMRNFGHAGPENFEAIGINGKNSEYHAAMGLCVLKYVDNLMLERKNQYLLYEKTLKELKLRFLQVEKHCEFNFAYFPVVFRNEKELKRVIVELERKNVSPRRYFHPTLSKLNYLPGGVKTPMADSVAESILCLPLYHNLQNEEIAMICNLINAVCR